MKNSLVLSLGISLASIVGCKATPQYQIRQLPETSFDSWVLNARYVERFENYLFERGLILKGNHPEYKHQDLYVLILDTNATGVLNNQERGDEYRSSIANPIRYWKNMPPDADEEDPPDIWESWTLRPSTLNWLNNLYTSKKKKDLVVLSSQ